ncbi:MAG: hypothetical protein IAE77_14970 [Prosthecobacter sp.]|jgi:hypothetical protein|uniref:hypothetical protein n=1 Tax=Prosthecobacter sp. TaxID=1965333 RepID=UPI001A04A62B|nr:hypothetical protein [Prosthecobacter sp.]MBE2284759.1 hypothetical protein [Prosthecobacter sp.]
MNTDSGTSWSRRRVMTAALAGFGCRVAAEEGGLPHVRILFLGNSYTAGHSVPAMVGEVLLSSQVLAPHIGSYLQSSYRLAQHAADPDALKLLKQGADDGRPWDVLVVQEQSILSSVAAVNEEARQMMNEGFTKLVALALEANPKMLIVDFQVWARHARLWKEQSREALSTGRTPAEAHTRIRLANARAAQAAREKHPGASILVSPVGDFWWLVADTYPALPLYSDDGTHPDMLGAILTALIIAGTIGGRAVIENSTWIGECPFDQVERVKKVLLDHPEVFKNAGK